MYVIIDLQPIIGSIMSHASSSAGMSIVSSAFLSGKDNALLRVSRDLLEGAPLQRLHKAEEVPPVVPARREVLDVLLGDLALHPLQHPVDLHLHRPIQEALVPLDAVRQLRRIRQPCVRKVLLVPVDLRVQDQDHSSLMTALVSLSLLSQAEMLTRLAPWSLMNRTTLSQLTASWNLFGG